MTPRPVQPEPFVRGAPYPAAGEVPYPRANPTDTARLPSDTWHAAVVPAGVRLELVGDAEAIDIAYRTTSGNLGYRGDGAGITFSVWRAGRKVCEEEAVLGDGLIRLSLGSAAADKPATIYLPEGMQPVIQSLTAVKGEIRPAPVLPRWIAYGDSITQGWIASGPAQGWAAIAARKAGLDLANLGYASAGRGEIVSAEHIAALPADIISISYGASCWTRVPHSVGMVTKGFTGFLDVVRDGHPEVPIVVISPVLRPDAEDEPNRLGATLADIRHAIESVARDRIVDGDRTLALVAGEGIISADHLGDGIHPDDEGHKRIASTVGKALGLALKAAKESPGADVMKAAAESLSGGRMARGRGAVDPGHSGGNGSGPGGGRAAGHLRDAVPVKVAAGVGAGERAGAGAGGIDSFDTGTGVVDVIDPEDRVDHEYELASERGAVVVEDVYDEVDEVGGNEEAVGYEEVTEAVGWEETVGTEVETAGTEKVDECEKVVGVVGTDIEILGTEEVDAEADVAIDDPEPDADSDLQPGAESKDNLTRPPMVAGEYVYEDYVDYENDLGYEIGIGIGTERGVGRQDGHTGERPDEVAQDTDTDSDGDSDGDTDSEAVADAEVEVEVEVKRKGGGRKGRGMAASSSSR